MRIQKAGFSICLTLILLTFTVSAFPQTTQPLTAILGAQTREVAMLRDELEGRREHTILGLPFWEGTLAGRRVVITRMASGKVNAAMAATLAIEHFRPSEVIVTGIAGGINPQLGPGDLVIAVKTAQHDVVRYHPKGAIEYRGARNPVFGGRNPVFLETNRRLVEIAQAAAKKTVFIPIPLPDRKTTHTVQVITGIVATGDAFIASDEKREQLRKDLEADVVEMEGAAVAQICHHLKTPCLVIRCLSDFADDTAIADFEVFADRAAANSAHLVREILRILAAERE